MQIGPAVRAIRILAVEDNPADVRLLVEALKDATVRNELQVVGSGREALDTLLGQYAEQETFVPDIVLLDLNLPDLSGQDVLEYIKTHPSLRRLPVIILTTSQEDRDIAECYRRYANSYITKPADYGRFIQVVKTIEEFWLSTATLPSIQPA